MARRQRARGAEPRATRSSTCLLKRSRSNAPAISTMPCALTSACCAQRRSCRGAQQSRHAFFRRKARRKTLPPIMRARSRLMPQLLQQYAGILRDAHVASAASLAKRSRRQAAAWPKRLSVTRAVRRRRARRDRRQSAAAASSAIDAGARYRVRTPADCVARVACSRRNCRQSGCRHPFSASPARSRKTVLHQRICLRHHARRRRRSSTLLASDRRHTSGAAIEPMQLAALAMYVPLHAVPARRSAARTRMDIRQSTAVLTQQLREPAQEQRAARFNSAPHRNRRRSLAARAPAIRREPLPALGACRRTSRADADRSIFARPVSDSRLRAARQNQRVSTCSSQAAAPARSRSDPCRNTWARRRLRST